jgi:hypothetical protein
MRDQFFPTLTEFRAKYDSMLVQYSILSRSSQFVSVLYFLHSNGLEYELHLNRTRFWINHNSRAHTLLMLRYGEHIHCVDHEQDYSLGI